MLLRNSFAIDRYTNCQVSYQNGQQTGQATTDASGNFAVPVMGATSFAGGLLSLPATAPGCVDALTKLPPPFSVGALVPQGTSEMPQALSSARVVGSGMSCDSLSDSAVLVLTLPCACV
jgi:hypothetical protein